MTKQKITVIAEIGSVHDGSYGNAIKLIDLAKDCGSDAVKFQTHLAEEETLKNAPSPKYFKSENRYEYFKRTSFSINQIIDLKKHANKIGLKFISSPFSVKAAKILRKINIDGIKVASGEVTNLPMLEEIANQNTNIYLSSGMSNWSEIDTAVNLLKRKKNKITVFQCTSKYPTFPKDVGLNIIKEMKNRYKLPVGFSDHTLGTAASIAAVVCGATVIEKHLTFSRNMYGSDAKNSLEPSEFREMIKGIREVSTMISINIDKNNLRPYTEMKNIFQKSIVASKKINKNTVITKSLLSYKKPGNGISSALYKKLIGKKIKKTVQKDYIFKESDFI